MSKGFVVRFRGEDIPYNPKELRATEPSKSQSLPTFRLSYDSEAAPIDEDSDEVQTMQIFDGRADRFEYVEPGQAFRHFWSILIRSVPEYIWKSTKKRAETVPVYCHNWDYDFSMIIKEAPTAWIVQHKNNHFYKGFEDTVTAGKSKYKLISEGGHMRGNAPSLTVVISRKGFHVKLKFYDTFPFFPKALATAAKDLGMEKGHRDELIGVDWRRVGYEDIIIGKDKDGNEVKVTKKQFEDYAKMDARIVDGLAERISQLHALENLTSLAVSGAGYAAKVLKRRLLAPIFGGYGGKAAVQIALDAFHGGRSGRLVHGHVKGVSVYDFRSSYPSIQINLPALHEEYTLVYQHKNLSVPEFMELAKKYHGFARVSGVERDSQYPAILSADDKGSIRPIVGEFENVPATAAEIYLGITCGGLEISSVGECIFYAPKEGMELARPFSGFIKRAYERKNSYKKGTIEYDAAKIQANSGYGKMIEHRGVKTFMLDDLDIPLPCPGKEGDAAARNFFLQYHPDYWHEHLKEWSEICGDCPDEYANLKDLINTNSEFGYYAIPQYAAWITGHAHARLVMLIRVLRAVKWDTDSAVTHMNREQVEKALASIAPDMLPDYIQPLTIGDELGELDREAENLAGVILGNKRYYLEGTKEKNGEKIPDIKSANHGMPGVNKKDLRGLMFKEEKYYKYNPKTKRLELAYESKSRPNKIGSTKDVKQIGKFHTKTMFPQFEWNEQQEHENGDYKPFAGFKK